MCFIKEEQSSCPVAIPQEKLKINKVNGLGKLIGHLWLGPKALQTLEWSVESEGPGPRLGPGSQELFPPLMNTSHTLSPIPALVQEQYARLGRKNK